MNCDVPNNEFCFQCKDSATKCFLVMIMNAVMYNLVCSKVAPSSLGFCEPHILASCRGEFSSDVCKESNSQS